MQPSGMKKSTALLLITLELSVIIWWLGSIHFEQGVDAILYHRMAAAITRYGYAPWVVNPLSYVGIYPGSDSSAVPFLVASTSALAGIPIGAGVLIYDLIILILFTLGLFVLVHTVTHAPNASLLAVLMGGLSYGFSTAILWTLDERSFNVAVAPIFLYLLISITTGRRQGHGRTQLVLLAVVSFVMYASHLNFLLLLPLVTVLPLFHAVTMRQNSFRRKRLSSASYVLAAVTLPVAVIIFMSLTGLMSGLGLELSLEQSALFTGSTPLAYLANTMVFVSTQAGPVIIVLAAVGLLYMGTRRFVTEERVLIAGVLLGGLVGLPIIVYSKDLVTIMLVLPAAVALPSVLRNPRSKAGAALAVAAVVVLSGSVAFDAWNLNRTLPGAEARYWTSPGITSEPVSANLWIGAQSNAPVCIYANNWLAARFSSTDPYELLCGDSSVDDLVHMELTPHSADAIHFQFVGVNGINPGNWFDSPEVAQMAADFSRLPSLDFASGVSLLLRYHVAFVMVSMANPTQIPLHGYQGTVESRFFEQLWTNGYPLYRTEEYAIFAV